jgi:hypothetical protein
LLHNVFAKSRTLVHSKNCTDPAGYAANNTADDRTCRSRRSIACRSALGRTARHALGFCGQRHCQRHGQSRDRWDAIFYDVFS